MNLEEALKKIADLEAEKTALATTNAELTTQVGEKDAKILTLEDNAKKQGENFKKLRDMSKEEKELLSEKELELLKRQEEVENQALSVKQQQDKFFQDQRASVLKNLVDKYAKGDVELAKKIEFNLGRMKDSELAMNEEALSPLVKDSFNMLGAEVTDAVRNAHNERGGNQDYKPQETGFADTQHGKDLSDALFGKETAGDQA